jgi:hypothetical protein
MGTKEFTKTPWKFMMNESCVLTGFSPEFFVMKGTTNIVLGPGNFITWNKQQFMFNGMVFFNDATYFWQASTVPGKMEFDIDFNGKHPAKGEKKVIEEFIESFVTKIKIEVGFINVY